VGQGGEAVVELKPGAAFDAGAIVATVKEQLGPVQTPKLVEAWEELPRSGNGKVLKRKVRDRFWKHADRQV